MSRKTTYNAVAIGVSSGGLNALKQLLPALPAETPFAILIVQHISPASDSSWITLLDKECKIKIKEAEEKENIEKGTAYVAPPNYHLLVEKDKTFSLSTDARVNYARPSIDVLFESAADAYGKKLAGIILTGSNHDGAAGLKKIKQKGGFTIVQDPASAESSLMPASAIEALHPDMILSLPQIKEKLIEFSVSSKPALP